MMPGFSQAVEPGIVLAPGIYFHGSNSLPIVIKRVEMNGENIQTGFRGIFLEGWNYQFERTDFKGISFDSKRSGNITNIPPLRIYVHGPDKIGIQNTMNDSNPEHIYTRSAPDRSYMCYFDNDKNKEPYRSGFYVAQLGHFVGGPVSEARYMLNAATFLSYGKATMNGRLLEFTSDNFANRVSIDTAHPEDSTLQRETRVSQIDCKSAAELK